MAKYTTFEELPVWKEAARLYNRVLDFVGQPSVPLTPSFRTQLERAALSVSNNIAEGFERVGNSELSSFLATARSSGGEVRSMLAVVKDRPRLKAHLQSLEEIRALAESCVRQLGAWSGSLKASDGPGKRQLVGSDREKRVMADKARNYRENFLRGLKPEHPLYASPEARAAREAPKGTLPQ